MGVTQQIKLNTWGLVCHFLHKETDEPLDWIDFFSFQINDLSQSSEISTSVGGDLDFNINLLNCDISLSRIS